MEVLLVAVMQVGDMALLEVQVVGGMGVVDPLVEATAEGDHLVGTALLEALAVVDMAAQVHQVAITVAKDLLATTDHPEAQGVESMDVDAHRQGIWVDLAKGPLGEMVMVGR